MPSPPFQVTWMVGYDFGICEQVIERLMLQVRPYILVRNVFTAFHPSHEHVW
jgi:hypothetical protein